jgi:hypothetical protein
VSTTLANPEQLEVPSSSDSIKRHVTSLIDQLITSLPDPQQLTSSERRSIIARYTSVLEGNFIYWMTATLLAVQSEDARPILLDNLYEEVRDAHPVMLRRFAVAAHAFPTDNDALALDEELTAVRRFLGKLSSVQSLATMAFFEGCIQQFMPFLAKLAACEGSSEMEYTDVHGVCDIAHTDGLFQALSIEMENNPLAPEADVFEGVTLLYDLMHKVVFSQEASARA